MKFRALGLLLCLAASMGGCARYDYTGSLNIPPVAGTLTRTGEALAGLPPPVKPVGVAVYDFQDLTGQNKSSLNTGFAEFSRAITQGASVILVDALKTAGRGTWFDVAERGYLDSLLRERRLIQETYTVLKRNPRTLIDPLKFAEYLITGGIVSYDSPIATGSAAGGYAGYAGGLSGSKDLVTVNVRLVRVRDGIVIRSVNVSRPIVTLGASASVARVYRNSILDAQASLGIQEATQTAVREAIETAVYELVRQNVQSGFWSLGDLPVAAAEAPLPPPPPRELGPPLSRLGATNPAAAPAVAAAPVAAPTVRIAAALPPAAPLPVIAQLPPAAPRSLRQPPEPTVTGSTAPPEPVQEVAFQVGKDPAR